MLRFRALDVRPERLSDVTATMATGARRRVCGGTAQPGLRNRDYNRRPADARSFRNMLEVYEGVARADGAAGSLLQ